MEIINMIPVGNPAVGNDFIDREKEISLILSTLEKDSVLLIAPRRFGKTSIMRKLEKELLDADEICVFLEVEDVNTPHRFISEIVMALIENEKIEQRTKLIPAFKNGFQWFKDNIEEIGISVFKAKLRGNIDKDLKDNWIDKSAQIFDIINEADSNIYFIFDEFPIAIDKMDQKDAEEFLHWFRKLRQVSPNLRFIVGGSVSIDRVVRDVGGVSVINDFKKVHVEGFQRQIALDLIEKTFHEEGWTYLPSYGDRILDCIGESYIPYFIAIMLSAIKEEYILRDGEINDELIEKIYNFRILGNEGKHYFEHYSQRLRIFYSNMEEKAARAILKNVCNVDYYSVDLAFGIFKQETAIDDYEQFMDLIADLSNDFYLEHDPENGLKFYSKMLQDWWRIYHGDVQ
jgi:AAA+ ATPase superfamily predicted ATPase